MIKKTAAVMLAAIMGLSAVSATGVYAAEGNAELPSKIDLRDYNGMNYVTPVKLQSPNGTCWAFGAATAAETSYLYANGLGVPAGTDNNYVNYSEKYIAWYLYHAITEDDVQKGRIRASQVGEGSDMSSLEQEERNVAYQIGGNGASCMNFFASGFGPVDESVTVNGDTPYYYSGKDRIRSEWGMGYSEKDDWTLPLNAEYRNVPVNTALKSCNMLSSPAAYDKDEKYHLDEQALNTMKSELSQGRAIGVGVCFGSNMHPTNWAMYNYGSGQANHEVTIVGYDDNYSKDNFTRSLSSGKPLTRTTPPADGAFIVKNTEGSLTEEDKATAVTDANGITHYQRPDAGKFGVDDSGYFYLSYYDHSISGPVTYTFGDSDSEKYSSHNIDQYDFVFSGLLESGEYETETKMANVFDAEEDEYLYRITYGVNDPNTKVGYEIYKNVGADPTDGVLLEKGETRNAFSGYHTLDLKGEYFLKQGEKYSVVLTMERETDDGRSVYSDALPFAINVAVNGSGTTNTGIVNSGESFFCSDGVWSDMADIKESLVDRVYQKAMEYTGEKASLIAMNPDGRDGFSVDNYPIKAELVPASEHKDEITIGDVNRDGTVNVLDAAEIQKYTANKAVFDEAQKSAADVNDDGTVDVLDALDIQKFAVEKITGFAKKA